MKKFKLGLMIIAVVFSACLLVGCGNDDSKKEDNSPKNEEKTIATTLKDQFNEEIKNDKDLESVANKLAKNEVIKVALNVATIGKKDYISGFTTEIKGFKKAVTIRPMISTIPFMAYIFEVEKAEEFAENLKSNADLRWNVCTEADDLEVSVVDNYVFIVMSPKKFEEE